ncbi:hypothetical protein [Rickettsiella massiliensis]|uniref:hypothetical protein n=1 Tax=Rickettsiella massiliensis TaxID=676517 RepID=UPI0012EA7628|nr:hypothetical protein [Rickettsiella massiliensis]
MKDINELLYDAKLEKLKWELKNYFSGWLLAILIGENLIIAILLLKAVLTHSS